MKSPRILLNLFHPNLADSRGNRLLLEAVRSVPGLTVNDVYAAYPTGKIDVGAEQARLSSHDLILVQHPFYWYSAPSLCKEWLDQVFAFGFAYPPGHGNALLGKHWLSVVTTGGPEWSYQAGGYNNYTMSELLRPFQQTAYLSGMFWQTPFVVHGVLPESVSGLQRTADETIIAAGAKLAERLRRFDLDERHRLEPVIAPHSRKA